MYFACYNKKITIWHINTKQPGLEKGALEMATTTVDPHKSSIGGLDANIMALIAYIGGAVIGWIPVLRYFAWLVPIVIFFLEKNSTFVKFHAMQAFLLNVVGSVLSLIVYVLIGGIIRAANPYQMFGTLAIVGVLVMIISIIITIFSILALYNAYKYKLYFIPVIGKLADKLSTKTGAK
jgi:uncharacterized membrane protein